VDCYAQGAWLVTPNLPIYAGLTAGGELVGSELTCCWRVGWWRDDRKPLLAEERKWKYVK